MNELKRVTPLRRGTPLPPGAPLARKAPLKATGKDTGPSREVRALVLRRDGYSCVCCGVSVIGKRYSLQHRKRRSQLGRSLPSNLVTVLGLGGEACHGRIDFRRDPADEAKGYSVRSGDDPAAIPVMVFSADGSGMTVWLDDAGNYRDEDGNVITALGRAA